MEMSSKATSSSNKSDGKKRPSAAATGKHAANGNARNGHGHATATTTRKATRARAIQANDADDAVLDGQPPLAALIGLARDGSRQLDKKTLLSGLVAIRKGDFSARLPIGLEGLDGKIADEIGSA